MGEDRVVAGERADAVSEAAVDVALRAFDDGAMGGFDSLRDDEWPRHAMQAALAAAAPLLPGGGVRQVCSWCEGTGWLCDGCNRPEALCMASECRGAALSMSGCPKCFVPGECGGRGYVLLPGGGEAEPWAPNERQAVLDCINLYGDETLHKALDDIGFVARSARPDAERAPQEEPPKENLGSALAGTWSVPRPEPRSRGDEVETVARVMSHYFFLPVRERAERVLAALDARSGADTVKLRTDDVDDAIIESLVAEVESAKCDAVKQIIEALRKHGPAGYGYVTDWIEAEFASGADRPEGSQT